MAEQESGFASRAQMALSFGQAAGLYEQGRPSYPAAAVEWMLPAGALVADVGAGTGKFTAVIAATGRTVIAIEPDEGMLAALGTNYPQLETRLGTGERLPLPDDSVDAVTFAQAWHWVDVELASAEVARVLRPGGTLGLVWNIRDERVPWVRRLSEIMHGSPAERLIAEGGPSVGPPFGPLEHWTADWNRELSVDDVLAMAASRSYVITAPKDRQEQIARDIRDLLTTDPATSSSDTITMPYTTHAYRNRTPTPP